MMRDRHLLKIFLVLILLLGVTACEEDQASSETVQQSGEQEKLYSEVLDLSSEPRAPALVAPEAPYESPLFLVTDGGQTTHQFFVEIADTQPERSKGLMNRETMPSNAGMLFDFFVERELGFWMKDTLIPLDMIFIKPDGTIHKIHHSAIPHDLTSIKSDGPVNAVLELHGGTAKDIGLAVGDTVRHEIFFNAEDME